LARARLNLDSCRADHFSDFKHTRTVHRGGGCCDGWATWAVDEIDDRYMDHGKGRREIAILLRWLYFLRRIQERDCLNLAKLKVPKLSDPGCLQRVVLASPVVESGDGRHTAKRHAKGALQLRPFGRVSCSEAGGRQQPA